MQVQSRAFQGTACRHAAGEHPDLAVAAQVDLAYPALAAGGDAQGQALIGAQGLPAFFQRGDAEGVVRQGGQPPGQRTLVEQPVADSGAGGGMKLGGGQPAGRMGKGGVGNRRGLDGGRRRRLARPMAVGCLLPTGG
ncbi:hypothetical protein D9M73_190200 [compost metagenome]